MSERFYTQGRSVSSRSSGGGGVSISMQVLGLQELEQALKDLRKELGGRDRNIVKLSLGAVARDVQKKMAYLAPESDEGSHIDWHKSRNNKWVHGGESGERAAPGRLRRSIFVKYERNPRKLSEVVYVGPRMGKDRNDPKGAWYAAIVEMHGGKGGKGRGFMRNSISPQFHARMFRDELAKRIMAAAKRIGNENIKRVAAKVKGL